MQKILVLSVGVSFLFSTFAPELAERCSARNHKTMEKKQILLVNDIAGYSKISTTAMMPILSYYGYPTCNLPTMIISNTLYYGKFNRLDTTEYIKGVFPVWKELGFSFSAIATGFIMSEEQADVIAHFCQEQATEGATIFVDPIMGDGGQLYKGVTPATIGSMKEMLSVAHLCYPNYTEACYLTGSDFREEGVSQEEAYRLLDQLCKIGTRSALITSIIVDGQTAVVGFNHETGEYFTLPFTEIPVHFPGTGDVFSAFLISYLMDGQPLKESTRKAMDAVYKLIDFNKNNDDKFRGMLIEKYLHLL